MFAQDMLFAKDSVTIAHTSKKIQVLVNKFESAARSLF